MYVKHFKKYIEGIDISKIPFEYMAYPSSDVLLYKGAITTRKGTEILGSAGTAEEATYGFTWKGARGGERSMRTHGVDLEVFYDEDWNKINNIDLADADIDHAEWVDQVRTPAIVKERLVMVDGSDKFLDWNGAIGVVESVDEGAQTITIVGTTTLIGVGFEDASVTNEEIRINDTVYNRDDNGTTLVIHTTSAFTGIVAGDLVFSSPQQNDGGLNGFLKDLIYVYGNHIVVAGYNTNEVYFSHAETFLDYTLPASGSRTAITSFVLLLDNKLTAMHERKNTLWISTIDDWFRLTKLDSEDAYGLWISIEKLDSAERKGALPRAVTSLVDDTIFISQAGTLERITDQEIIQVDKVKLMSDDVDNLFLRLDLTSAKIHYSNRYVIITVPNEGKIIMYDNIEEGFQPPMNIGCTSVNIADSILIGHSNATDTSFKMFIGRRDLATEDDVTSGIPVEGTIAFGFGGGKHEFYNEQFTMMGLQGRITAGTKISVENQYEDSGAKAKQSFSFIGSEIKTFKSTVDASIATHPFGSLSFAGADVGATDLERFYVYKKFTALSFLEFRPVITITAIEDGEAEFHLIGIFADRTQSDRKIDDNLFINQ